MTYHKGRLLNSIARVLMGLLVIFFFLPIIAYSQTEDVNTLIQELKDEDWRVRQEAAWALGEIGDQRAVEPLITALKDEDWRVLIWVIVALVKIGTPAVEPLIVALKDEDWRVRQGTAVALGQIGDPRAVEPLIVALKDEGSLVRKEAAGALGGIGDPRAVLPLIAVLKDEDSGVRMEAAISLGKIKDLQAVKPLIAVLKDKDLDVRVYAAKALGQIGDPLAVEPLIAALNDEDRFVRERAAEALREITGKDFGNDPEKWQDWWERNKTEAEEFKRFEMDNGYFSCNIPKDWDFTKTDERKAKKGVYGLQVVGGRVDDAPTLARVTFYLNDNIYFNGYNDFIESNSKDIFGDTKTETDTYGPVEEIKLNGRIAYRFEREIKEYTSPGTKSWAFVMLKEKFYVIPSEKGFHVLQFMSSEPSYSKYLPIFEKIVYSFRGI